MVKESSDKLKKLDWWEHAVVYQLYVRSFQDSDGDGVGDLKGIINKLDYLAETGVDVIWLSPIFVSPMVDFGYDISDFYEIHNEYGTIADYEELLSKAHDLDMRVILDFVPNHASVQSKYFKLSEAKKPGYENFFIWADPSSDPKNASKRLLPSNWISRFGRPAWKWSEQRQQYFFHQFFPEQADFNLREPAVKKELENIMKFWLEKGVDGFRLDAIPYLFEANPDDYGGRYPNESGPQVQKITATPSEQFGYITMEHTKDQLESYEIICEWREFIEEWKEHSGSATKILIGEAYAKLPKTMLYYCDLNGRLETHFPLNYILVTSLKENYGAKQFADTIQSWFAYMPSGQVPNWQLSNHDNQRTATKFGNKMVDGLNAMIMVLPGVVTTYQGEEIGLRDAHVSWADTKDYFALDRGTPDTYSQYSRDRCRTPFHWDNTKNAGFSTSNRTWLPVSQDYKKLNLQAQRIADRSHYKVYQSLTKLRKHQTFLYGRHYIEDLTNNILFIARSLATYDTFALLFNVGQQADTIDLLHATLLKDPITVCVASTHSSRMVGDIIPRDKLKLQPGEALVLRAPST